MFGTKILEERRSKINGSIRVTKTLGLGIYIQAEGLTQSGGVVESIWRTTLKKINHQHPTINNCLILGLGAGSATKWVRKLWPQAKVTGVEIDPVMVEMGKKYLGLNEVDIDIIISDAKKLKIHETCDLILVDLYIGRDVPGEFETDKYISVIKKLLSKQGIAVFNRLYYGEKRPNAQKFGRKLEKFFREVEYFYPEANLMFICKP